MQIHNPLHQIILSALEAWLNGFKGIKDYRTIYHLKFLAAYRGRVIKRGSNEHFSRLLPDLAVFFELNDVKAPA